MGGTAGSVGMVLPASTRISARMKRVQKHSSPVHNLWHSRFQAAVAYMTLYSHRLSCILRRRPRNNTQTGDLSVGSNESKLIRRTSPVSNIWKCSVIQPSSSSTLGTAACIMTSVKNQMFSDSQYSRGAILDSQSPKRGCQTLSVSFIESLVIVVRVSISSTDHDVAWHGVAWHLNY